jgi:RNA polymerase primary sigma factor
MRQLKITHQITERTPTTERYLSEVSPIEMISQEREVELAKKIREGDKKAEHELVKANLRFVISCAKQYQNRGMSLDDLINEGNLGLIKAAQRFDETRGFKFISYAVGWIRQAIMEAIQKHSRTVRLPSNRIQQINELREVTSKLAQENEGQISIADVCDKMKIDYETYNLLMASNGSVSMDKKVSDDDDLTLHDFMKDENSDLELHISSMSMKRQIQMALSCLNDLEKEIILNSFGLNKDEREMTLGELAERNDYSSERIRQIREKSLIKMKRFLINRCKMTTIEK